MTRPFTNLEKIFQYDQSLMDFSKPKKYLAFTKLGIFYLSIYNVTQIDYDKPEVGPGQ